MVLSSNDTIPDVIASLTPGMWLMPVPIAYPTPTAPTTRTPVVPTTAVVPPAAAEPPVLPLSHHAPPIANVASLPSGSVYSIGLFSAYVYRFQACGRARKARNFCSPSSPSWRRQNSCLSTDKKRPQFGLYVRARM